MTRRTFTIVLLVIIMFVIGCLYELIRTEQPQQTKEIDLPDIHIQPNRSQQ